MKSIAKKEGRERRKFVRIASSYILNCSKLSVQSSEQDHLVNAATKDISAGGLLFQSKRKFALGDILKMEIEVRGWEKFKAQFYKPDETSASKPLVVLGAVVRIEEVIPSRLYDIGVSFASIDDGHQLALIKYIDNQLKKRSS